MEKICIKIYDTEKTTTVKRIEYLKFNDLNSMFTPQFTLNYTFHYDKIKKKFIYSIQKII